MAVRVSCIRSDTGNDWRTMAAAGSTRLLGSDASTSAASRRKRLARSSTGTPSGGEGSGTRACAVTSTLPVVEKTSLAGNAPSVNWTVGGRPVTALRASWGTRIWPPLRRVKMTSTPTMSARATSDRLCSSLTAPLAMLMIVAAMKPYLFFCLCRYAVLRRTSHKQQVRISVHQAGIDGQRGTTNRQYSLFTSL